MEALEFLRNVGLLLSKDVNAKAELMDAAGYDRKVIANMVTKAGMAQAMEKAINKGF